MRSVLDKFKNAPVSCFWYEFVLTQFNFAHFSKLMLLQLQTSSIIHPEQSATKGVAANESSGGCSSAENKDVKENDNERKESYGSDVKEGCNCG
jgi:hypothetical protein